MTKPEIIGYQTDPDRWWAMPQAPEITMDSDGISVPRPYWDRNGGMYEEQRYLDSDEVDRFMRDHGMKRIYRDRQFHAKPKYGGYLLYCRTCETNTLTSGYLPHDSALRHRCPVS